MRASIGGVTFDEWPRDFDESFVISPNGLKGWFSGTSMRRDETPRPGAHGAFDAPGFQSARVVSIEGTILARSEQALEAMILQLTGLLADGDMGRLSVQDDAARVTWADVRLADQTQIDRHPTGTEADFQIQFWAPDPRRFGEARVFSGDDLSVFHRGNFMAPIEFVIPNAPAAWHVDAGVNTIDVTGAPAGVTHRLDMRTGRLYAGGALQFGKVYGDVWSLRPGPPVVHSITGIGSFEVHTVDTFI